jgi:hypothetical protein
VVRSGHVNTIGNFMGRPPVKSSTDQGGGVLRFSSVAGELVSTFLSLLGDDDMDKLSSILSGAGECNRVAWAYLSVLDVCFCSIGSVVASSLQRRALLQPQHRTCDELFVSESGGSLFQEGQD